MERQRSFSVKHTKLQLFSFTMSSVISFLTLFSIWVSKITPSFYQVTHAHFKKPSLNPSPKPIVFQSFSGFSRNSRESRANFGRPEGASGPAEISAFSELWKAKNGTEMIEEQRKSNVTTKNKSTSNSASEEIKGPNSRIETVEERRKSKIVSGSSNLSTMEGERRKKNEFGAAIGGFQRKENSLSCNVCVETEELKEEKIEERSREKCDITKGNWVFDESYPLYTNNSCPFIDEGFNCLGNGRLDKEYMKWRWKPLDCDIPRFNATKMLELIRGKRLVFVGDSINRNQWESMLCLLVGGIKDPKRAYEIHRRKITKEKGNYSFKFVDYRCTVEYYVTHFLVHEGKARVARRRKQTLQIDTIDRGSSRWKGADILVFNTAHWWSHYKTQAGINYYQERDQLHPHLDVATAYRKALMTWASWIDKHINPGKTRVFFRSLAPSHFRGGQWNSGGHCGESTIPLNETFNSSYPKKNIITEEVIKQMRTPVTLLNITALSNYRIDGHPSIYGRAPSKRSSKFQDCSHWCLPGVPDTWNELLYFYFLDDKQAI